MILSDRALHLNLDDAWPSESIGLPVVDARSWGPHLRFSAPPRLIEQFYREHGRDLAAPFLLYGSGDFHHLTALRLRLLPNRSSSYPLIIIPIGMCGRRNGPVADGSIARWNIQMYGL